MFSLSAVSLLLSNLIPLIGVLFWGWELPLIMFVYWAESGIIGILNIFKILLATKVTSIEPTVSSIGDKLMMIPFFILHYGIFMLVHGVFVFVLFKPQVSLEWILAALIPLFISHCFSLLVNFISKKEYKEVTPGQQMFAPYSRIIVMHLTIIIGGGLILVLHLPQVAAAIMVILKIITDLLAHIAEHKKIKVIITKPDSEKSDLEIAESN